MDDCSAQPVSAFRAIRAVDYTVIIARDMAAMRRFYEDILGFPVARELSPGWIEYRLGGNTLTLARSRRVDRKSVVEGKSGSVRVKLGGRGIIKQKKKT